MPTTASVSIANACGVLMSSTDDADEAALVTREITPISSGYGVISDTGAVDGQALLSFVLEADTFEELDPATTHFRAIKVVLSNGQASAPADPIAPVRILAAGAGQVS